MITPKTGEHPLATKCRQLHLELFRAYAFLAFTGFGIAFATLAAGYPLGSIAATLCACGFVVLARTELRWSR